MSDIGAQINHFIRHRRRVAIALATGAVVLVVIIILVATDRYPIMVVNGALISARRFEQNFASAAVYRDNLVRSNEGSQETVEALQRVTFEDLGAGVLDQLVAAVLVDRGARREVGSDLPGLVHGKIDEYGNDPEIQRGVQTLYGMGYADFRDEVLVPQAERDILAGRLFLRGQDIEQWLAGERQQASVYVLSSRFRWDGEKVVAQ